MSTEISGHPRLERLLATTLHYGTWLSSGVIALGLALSLLDSHADGHRSLALVSGVQIVTAGIALLILLPVLRVTIVLIVFVRERDYRFGAIAALVLMIIVMSLLLGIYAAPVS